MIVVTARDVLCYRLTPWSRCTVKCGRSQNLCSDGGAGVNIQRAAEASGLTANAIRFYEKKGVLPAVPRLT